MKVRKNLFQIIGGERVNDFEGIYGLLIIGGFILDYWWEKIFQVGAFYLFYRMLKAGETVIYSSIKERNAIQEVKK